MFNQFLRPYTIDIIFRKKTVVVSLWNDLATNIGQELLDMSDKSPVVAIKSVKVGDFQGTEHNALLISDELDLL